MPDLRCFPAGGVDEEAQSNLITPGARWLISLFRSRRVRGELELTASRVNRRVKLPSASDESHEWNRQWEVMLLRVACPHLRNLP